MKKSYATRWKQAASVPVGVIGRSRSILRDTALSVSSAISRNSARQYLRCLYCHYVFDDQKQAFERLIVTLRNHGQFVDTDTCIQMLQGKKEIDAGYFHLSFDDGFRNCFTNAVPILRKHAIPAIFFVPSSLIEATWDDTKTYCLKTTRYRAVIEMLRWADLCEMVSLGFEVGSHTRTHARFSDISRNHSLMKDEIQGSKEELQAHIGQECKYISWPYGTLTDADDESLKTAKSAGYAACFGAYRGSVVPGKTDIFSIPRHHFEAQWPISHVLYFARGNMEKG